MITLCKCKKTDQKSCVSCVVVYVNLKLFLQFLYLLYPFLLGRLLHRTAVMNLVLFCCLADDTDGVFVILTKNPQFLVVEKTNVLVPVVLLCIIVVRSFL